MNNNMEQIIDIEDGQENDGYAIKDFEPSGSTPTIDSLIGQYNNGVLQIPNFQRKFVWSEQQASRFIESVLLEIPIPSVTFYTDENSNQLIIDGQQRIKSILLFSAMVKRELLTDEEKKLFGFKLVGLSKDSPYYNMSFHTLGENEQKRFLYKCTLNVNLIKLKDPNNLCTVYYIFERLNTGGTPLSSQEIRNCICAGSFNDFLIELNKYENWRKFFTDKTAVAHQKDIELILRFFALYDMNSFYSRPMKDYLTNYMRDTRNISDIQMHEKEKLFKATVDAIYTTIGKKAFRFSRGLNAAILDSVMIAFAKNLDNIPSDIKIKYQQLCESEEYIKYCSKSAGDNFSVKNRLQMANDFLFDKVQDINLKKIKLYDLAVSAGYGNLLSEDNISYSYITTKNRKADYAIRISGDSMEPLYHNNDVLLIKQQNTIYNGKIGIFLYDNEVRVKQYQQYKKYISLISLNKKYQPLEIDPNKQFIILGVVLDQEDI